MQLEDTQEVDALTVLEEIEVGELVGNTFIDDRFRAVIILFMDRYGLLDTPVDPLIYTLHLDAIS